MPEGHGYPNESEQERKQRIKKLKARTSKMRLAAVKEKSKKKADEFCELEMSKATGGMPLPFDMKSFL